VTAAERETRLPLTEAPAEGSVRMLEIGAHRIGLYRVSGRLYALANRCPHRGAPLCSGMVATPLEAVEGEVALGASASIVRCPWHKWEFDIASGRSLVDERLRVRRYAVRVEEEQVVVTLDHPERDGPPVAFSAETRAPQSP
jgi:nitrite reductase/ring-hydroxylating ferredoxin subunit